MSKKFDWLSSFTSADEKNWVPVQSDAAVNNRFGGRQVLFAEQYFPAFVYYMIVNGEEGYLSGYDGYAFY
jgi:hypothetical protein